MFVGFFFEQLEQFNSGYVGLFGKADEEVEEDAKERVEGFEKFWGWFVVLDRLSNSDRTKYDFFLNMNVVEFLNCISFLKDKTEYENNRIELLNAKR